MWDIRRFNLQDIESSLMSKTRICHLLHTRRESLFHVKEIGLQQTKAPSVGDEAVHCKRLLYSE